MPKISEQEVLSVIGKALNIVEGKLTKDSSIGDVEEWDSLGHLGILSALDELYGGKVANIKEMASADSVKKILQILKDKSLV